MDGSLLSGTGGDKPVPESSELLDSELLVKREVLVSPVARYEVTLAVCIGICVLEYRGMFPKGGFAGSLGISSR